MTKDLYKRCQAKDIGIGGMRCPCCFDLSNKKRVLRKGRKRLKQQTQQEIQLYIGGKI